MEVITREEAAQLELKNYFTGKPCKHGHISERNVKRGYCIECKAETKKQYYHEHKEELNNKLKEWKKSNTEKVNESSRRYKSIHKDKIKEQRKIYLSQQSAIDLKRESNRRWRKKDWQRYHHDPLYRCAKTCRNIIDRTIKASQTTKNANTFDILGYTVSDFKKHIEKQFTSGMTWENHGEWHIDHIYPISKYIDDGIGVRPAKLLLRHIFLKTHLSVMN